MFVYGTGKRFHAIDVKRFLVCSREAKRKTLVTNLLPLYYRPTFCMCHQAILDILILNCDGGSSLHQ